MSTKIYDAYRMPRGVDLLEFQTRARELANPIRDRLDAQEVARRAVTRLDRLMFGLAKPKEVPSTGRTDAIVAAMAAYDNEQRELGSHHALNDCHRFELSFIPAGKWVGVKAFTSRPDYAPVLAALVDEFGMEDFEYQNHADPPEDVPHEEYEARGKWWDKHLGDEPWSNVGLSFVLRGTPSMLMYRTEIVKALTDDMVPAKRARAYEVARGLVGQAAGKRATAETAWALLNKRNYSTDFVSEIEDALADLGPLGDVVEIGECRTTRSMRRAASDCSNRVLADSGTPR